MVRLYTRRRQFLPLLATLVVGSVAGCTGGGEDGTENTPTDTPTATPAPTPTTPNQQAVDHYEAAIDAFVQNKEQLDEWAESSYESSRVGTLQDRVSTAREELDAAGSAADSGSTLMIQIDQARLVADFQEVSLAYYEAVTVYFQVIEDAQSLGDNELHQRAADTYAEANGVLDDARQVIDDMGTILDEIDNEALDEPALEYTGEPLDHLDLADMQAIDAAESYALANENLHLAFVQLENGQAHYEKEEFTEARETWETGRQRTTDAQATFEETLDNDFTPQNLREGSIAKLGVVEGMVDAYDKFVEGAREAENGNLAEATSLVSEGYNILDETFN